MGTLKYIIHGMTLVTAFGGIPSVADASKASNTTRIAHAKELLGRVNYKKSATRKSESLVDISDFVEAMVSEWLPKSHGKNAVSLTNAIIHESEKYGFDPVFIVAVIQNESRFNPEMRGTHTEIGLMQVKPTTAKWIAEKMGLKFKGETTLLDPVGNIKIGVAFMAMLRDQFDSDSRLYISAYNMGARRVRQIVAADGMPKEYVQAVMKRYIAIYAAFADDDADNMGVLSGNALSRVRDITRSVASN